jgi:hypothetical protein
MFFSWVLYWGNTQNPDINNYMIQYESAIFAGNISMGAELQFGFLLIMKFCSALGMSFEFFVATITILSYLLIHSTVRKFSNNYNYFYLLYFIFPFFLDVVQIKNFLAMAIFIYAIQYLLTNLLKDKVKYVFLIIVAGTIHYAALLYLPMALINVKKKNELTRFIAVFAVVGSLVVLLNGKQIPFINEFVRLFFYSEEIIGWLETKTNLGFILFWAMQTASFFMVKYSKTLFIKNTVNNSFVSEKVSLFINLVYWINIMAFLFFPFYILASTFSRLMRNIILLNYISFSITSNLIKNRDEKIIFNLLVAVYVLFFFIVQLSPYMESVVEAIFKNNLIFK